MFFNSKQMDIIKFDLNTHCVKRAAELIVSAYGGGFTNIDQTRETVKGLVESGNNFLGHENMYVSLKDGNISGLLIGYTGKSGGTLRALFHLLSELRLRELLNYIVLNAELLHTGYTPDLSEDDFYISVVVVDEKQRGMGVGTSLMLKAIEIAREKGCSNVILDVDAENAPARSLYEKFGFNITDKNPKLLNGALPSKIYTMEFRLN